MTAASVTLYGKAGCHLCDEAREQVARAREQVPFELTEVDVSLDPVLQREYGERIPVVAVNGVETFELGLDAAELVAALRAGDASLE